MDMQAEVFTFILFFLAVMGVLVYILDWDERTRAKRE
jgi:hypothetical protein